MLRTPILVMVWAAGVAGACSKGGHTLAPETRAHESSRAPMALGFDPQDLPEGAAAAITAAQRQVRESPGDHAAYLGLARALLEARRATGDRATLALAAESVAAAEGLRPGDPEALALRGVLLSEEHRFAELARLAAEMIAADPADSTGYLLLGDARLELGDYEDAAAAYEQAMERFPDLRVYARGAHLRWLHGDVEGALELYEDAIQSAGRNPEHLAWVWTDVGQLFLHTGAPERARGAADRAEALVPGYPAAAALRARAARAAGDLAGAERAIRAALEARASAADQILLSEIAEARGDRGGAADARAAALALADHDPLPVALYLARRGEEVDRALELAEREVRLRPNLFSHSARALALLRAGRVADASAAIETALSLGTPLAELHLHDGLIKLARGDRDGARAAARRARELSPHDRPELAAELAEEIR